MRKDSLGLFWRDEPVIKVVKEKVKVVPPEPVWLKEDYLPGLEEAKALKDVVLLSDEELISLAGKGNELAFDIEVYPNYFLIGFKHWRTGQVTYLEAYEDEPLDTVKLEWILNNFTVFGFNSISYDLPITSLAVAGKPLKALKDASDRIIQWQEPWRNVLKSYNVKPLEVNHVDLIEVAPLRASLKVYGGRLHTPHMQDLPFPPEIKLSEDQKEITRYYCIAKDLMSTVLLREALDEHIKLREQMGQTYMMDLRSFSDAQIAEHVISAQVRRATGGRVSRPVIPPGTVYRYKAPKYLEFTTSPLQEAFRVVQGAQFVVGEHGAIEMPKELSAMKPHIGDRTYRMGIGGLHSTESKEGHWEDDNYQIFDYDVTSYYPQIVLNQGLYPKHLGSAFLQTYNSIVQTRIAAKQKGDKRTAATLKIVVNGSYGKFGSKYSNLYSPDLIIQVTLTGQLSLLLLIERFHMAGIKVISANTDGVVVKPHVQQIDHMRAVVAQWERDTRFNLEESRYLALYSRDVNNYIAVKKGFDAETKEWLNKPSGLKCKGAYANPWTHWEDRSELLWKNPTNTICIEAIENLFLQGKAIESTITTCTDIRKFISVRTVKGGAFKDGIFLGRAIRWYYAKGEDGAIVYALKGNKVPRSEGAKPLMDMPDSFPGDVDIDWYIKETYKLLEEIGFSK